MEAKYIALSVGKRFFEHCLVFGTVNVLCVFKQAVNLSADGGILSIVSQKTGRSASSLMITSASDLTLAPGETGSGEPGRICFRDTVIDFKLSPVWTGSIDKNYKRELLWENVRTVRAELERCAAPDSVWRLEPDSPVRRGISELWASPVDAVEKLVGLGLGLTPSGDDALLGYLAVYNHFSGDTPDADRYLRELRGAVSGRLNATTALSAQLLKNAVRCEYHEFVEGVLTALCDTPETIGAAMGKLLEIGATSGSDIASGMYIAAEQILVSGK